MTAATVPTPAWRDLGYSLRRHFVDSFYRREVARFAPGSLLLDLGGTTVEKRGRFDIANFAVEAVCVNCSRAKAPDVQAMAEALPFREGTFLAVICSELLEHVRSPEQVLEEVHRVLRPGGTLLVTVPFLVGVHADPEDYGRYTEHYWRRVLAERGFEVQTLECQGGFWSVICDLLRSWLVARVGAHGVLGRTLTRCLEGGLRLGRKRALAYEALHAGKGERLFVNFTTGYGIVARKSAKPAPAGS